MKKIFSLFLNLLLMLSMLFGSASCERMVFETEGDCPPENIEPEPEPGYVRISVRTELDKAGLSAVFEVADKANAAETESDNYVSIVVKENEAYTLNAEANEGYEFVGWHDDSHDNYLPAGEALVVNLKSDVSIRYTAVFAEVEAEPEPGYVRISVRTNLDEAGLSQVYEAADETNAAGTPGIRYVSIIVKENEAYTLNAEAYEGYEFVGWYDDTNDNYLLVGEPTFEKQSAVSTKYTAIFAEIDTAEPEPEPGYVRISVRTNLNKAGTSRVYEAADETNFAETQGIRYVSIVVRENASYTLEATVHDGYMFVGWYDDTNDNYLPADELVFENLQSAASTKYIAIFEPEEMAEPEPEPGNIRVSVRTNLDKAGLSQVYEAADETNAAETERIRYVGIEVRENEPYTLNAVANEGYVFLGWYDETHETYLEEEGALAENLKSSVSVKYIAIFEPAESEPEPGNIRISVKVDPDKGGKATVTSGTKTAQTDLNRYVSIEIKENATYTLRAEAYEGYEFVGWYDETHETYLEEGALVENLKSAVSVKYIAIFAPVEPEPEPDPTAYYAEFVYDRNMKFADAFPSQVKSVALYVFDADGNIVKNYKDSGAALSRKGYRLELTDLAPGTYQFLAWCGLEGNAYFSLPADIKTIEDAKLTMSRQTDGSVVFSKANLTPVYHGLTSDTLPEGKDYVVTLSLTKDTNNINLSLTQLGNAGMRSGQYTVSMTDDNGLMDYTNAPLAGNSIEYRPWYGPAYGSAQMGSGKDDAINYMRAELSTARLMKSHETRLIITDNETGKTVFSIPFMEYVKAFRSTNYNEMDDQEYLDREDEYNLTLYIENNKEGWIAARIEINGWRVNDNGEVDL